MLALAGVAVMAPLFAWAVRSPPVPVKAASAFESRYVDLPMAVAKKQDRLEPETRIVRTIPIVQPAVDKPVDKPVEIAAIDPEQVIERPVTRKRVRGTRHRVRTANVCTRHGMRKVQTGRSWRCRK
jgi:hypothetical protein